MNIKKGEFVDRQGQLIEWIDLSGLSVDVRLVGDEWINQAAAGQTHCWHRIKQKAVDKNVREGDDCKVSTQSTFKFATDTAVHDTVPAGKRRILLDKTSSFKSYALIDN